MSQRVSLIWAMTRNRVIGDKGVLPWDLPDEMSHFTKTTMGHPVIMGRRTFESRGSPLPGRHNIVLSRRGFSACGATVVHDLPEALAVAGDGDCFVIGGVSPCVEALPRAHRLIATVIDAEIDGDTVFPELDYTRWREIECVHHPADARHAHAFDITTLVRRC
ncbi:MAG: dihydrofolate reductase [Gammaproteobacteria bacterium]|nr:dihydrofolate reductase [Gammaproteobacteria bacterium]MXY58098.1 dihydrofolate reductase [Gammaproteobacteria bacterium]MYF30576.1 dihydrofolate reductase [Gammaproteobacteria bacterium]MYK48468.1 dihydrofolate reductase [Gammaproteobacteria bacterium]